MAETLDDDHRQSPGDADPPLEEVKPKEITESKKEVKKSPARRGRKPGAKRKGEEGKEEEEKKKRRRRSEGGEGASSTPRVERPSRERKAVERFAALSPRKVTPSKVPTIQQGRGTKLKDIPNVSFRISKRKVDENLQALHVILFGRKANAHYVKRNISQFSGFVWVENEEKQRVKLKEKLDKCNKDRLLDFCELLDVPAMRATTKKEEIAAKLAEFLESPCVTRDVLLAKKKAKKQKRRSKGVGQATSGEASSDGENKAEEKQQPGQSASAEEEEDEESVSGEAKGASGDENSGESEDNASEDEVQEEPAQKTPKNGPGVKTKEKTTPVRKDSSESGELEMMLEEGRGVTSKGDASEGSKNLKTKKSTKVKNSVETPSASRRKGNAVVNNELAPTSKSKKENKGKEQAKKTTATNSKNAGPKKAVKLGPKVSAKGKGKAKASSGTSPTTEEMREVVSEILREVDFNTATLADILRQLGAHFKMDLMNRKAEVKAIIEDVINNMSDDEEGEDCEDANDLEVTEENPGEASDGDDGK